VRAEWKNNCCDIKKVQEIIRDEGPTQLGKEEQEEDEEEEEEEGVQKEGQGQALPVKVSEEDRETQY
jgi:hypothetical protein